MKCLIVLAAVVALAASQLASEDGATTVTRIGPPAEEPAVPVVEAEATLDENSSTSEGDESSEGEESDESGSEEGTEEATAEGEAEPAVAEPAPAEPAPALPSAAAPAAAEPATAAPTAAAPEAPAETEAPAQPTVPVLRGSPVPPPAPTPVFVEVTPSSEAVVVPEARSFSFAPPTLIPRLRQPSLFFAPKTAAPSAAPTLAPLPKLPSLLEIVSRPPPPAPSTPRPYVSYRTNPDDKNGHLLYYNNEINPDGTYKYGFAIDNGIQAEAEGTLVDVYGDKNLLSQAVRGSFAWSYPDGNAVQISYTADENGYQPVGDAIPKIPPLIARALEWTANKRRLEAKLL